jgi:effector-binding domain-containing protein
MKVATLRMNAPYQQCGEGFSKIFKRFWFQSCGPPMLLCYDTEYKDVANYEVAVPIKVGESKDGIEVRELPAGRCVSLMHRGPYDEISLSYKKVCDYASTNGYKRLLPSREIYVKGPGMLFKGNPKNYLTEIQLLIE